MLYEFRRALPFTEALFFVSLLVFAPFARAGDELEEAVSFFQWLESHSREFAQCEPKRIGQDYVLCDQTLVSRDELQRLFASPPKKVLAMLREKQIRVEMVCDEAPGKPKLSEGCVPQGNDKMFSEISALHGKYVPERNTILIRDSATPGSLIHEYLHFLESENTRPVYGKVYKKERNQVQAALARFMEDKIHLVQSLEKAGRKAEARAPLREFMIASDAMRGFAPWQDLIDERSIFLLYLKFGKEFGATEADLELARRNMQFICRNPKLAPLLPKDQCKAAAKGTAETNGAPRLNIK